MDKMTKEVNKYKKEMGKFQFNLMKGKIVEAIIQNIYETAGYSVYPYGHESTLGKLKENFHNYKNHDETLKKIRYSPDFLIYDNENEKAFLIEVKLNNSENDEFQADYEMYKKYWPECYILLINPSSKNTYYIQQIKKLEPSKEFYNKNIHKKMKFYNIKNFEKIQKIFPKIGLKTVEDTFTILKGLKEITNNKEFKKKFSS